MSEGKCLYEVPDRSVKQLHMLATYIQILCYTMATLIVEYIAPGITTLMYGVVYTLV